MLTIKHYLIAMAVVFFFALLSGVQAEEMEQADCLPTGEHETKVAEAYNYGYYVGTREGYTNGQVDAARQILNWFEEQCTKPGEVVDLANGVSLVCK